MVDVHTGKEVETCLFVVESSWDRMEGGGLK